MGKDDRDLMEIVKQNYPKEPNHFQNMVKTRIVEQIGEEKAEQICKNEKKHNTQNRVLGKTLKWVAVFAILLVCGTTAAAAVNPELADYLFQLLKSEDVYPYMQEVNPEVKEKKEGEVQENELQNVELSLEKPLWEIVNAWYDGTTIYFSATPNEEAIKMADTYHMNPSDHCTVNGIDCMLDCGDADYAEGSLSEGEKTGQYHFKINVANIDISGLADVSFNLNISARAEEINGYTTQEIAFQIEDIKSAIKTVKEEDKEILLADGVSKVKIMNLKLSPSVMYVKLQYNIYGENAKERAEELRGREVYGPYDVMDSFGKQIKGGYPVLMEMTEVKEEADGSYSVVFEWETYGVDTETDTLTFLPYSIQVTADGKDGPITMLDWAKFTVSVE